MLNRSVISLARLVSRLSPILLRSEEGLLQVEGDVSTFVLHEPGDAKPLPQKALVLGIGVVTEDDARTLAERAVNATAIVMRETIAADPAIRAALGQRTQLLELRSEATWAQLASTLSVVFGLSGETPDSVAFGDAETDLFTLANSTSSLVGGPVTIEDLSFRILAFSADQADADDARANSVLGHQVPESYSSALHEQGLVRLIYDSPTPVYADNLLPEVLPRVAMRLQAGGELLGSVWVVVREPLSAERQQGLIEIANVIALTMLRIRMTQDSTTRLRIQRVLDLLEGGSSALEEARSAGLPLDGLAVLAVGLHHADGGSDTEFELQRLASALSMHLHSVTANAPVALLGDVVYAVVPLKSDASVERARAIANGFLARLAGARAVLIGVGSPLGVRELPVSQEEADRALRVLQNRGSDGSAAATGEDIFIDSLLLRMSDLVANSADTVTGPVQALVEYDAANGTQLVETLRAWLDHFGDVTSAAHELAIHKNTFRYRLRRLSELAQIDLTDPEQRFGLMLQLRLFPF